MPRAVSGMCVLESTDVEQSYSIDEPQFQSQRCIKDSLLNLKSFKVSAPFPTLLSFGVANSNTDQAQTFRTERLRSTILLLKFEKNWDLNMECISCSFGDISKYLY